MILAETFSRNWLLSVAKRFPKTVDLKLLEKVVWALHLLEHLQLQNLPFVFKGGTSLILHHEQPLRFSIDVDIIMPGRLDLTPYFDALVEGSTFVRWDDDSNRASHMGVPVGHYKFYYVSQVDPQHPLEPILLDILFAEVSYPRLIEKRSNIRGSVQPSHSLLYDFLIQIVCWEINSRLLLPTRRAFYTLRSDRLKSSSSFSTWATYSMWSVT